MINPFIIQELYHVHFTECPVSFSEENKDTPKHSCFYETRRVKDF